LTKEKEASTKTEKCPNPDCINGKVKDPMGEATAWFFCGVCHGTGEVER